MRDTSDFWRMRRGGLIRRKTGDENVTIDIEKLTPILTDAIAHGAVKTAEKHGVPKAYVQSLLSLARKLGAAPIGKPGATRKYDPAAVVEALKTHPIDDVAAEFNLSPATLLKIAADARKAGKSAPASSGETVQQQAA